jgi:hypothetical protein
MPFSRSTDPSREHSQRICPPATFSRTFFTDLKLLLPNLPTHNLFTLSHCSITSEHFQNPTARSKMGLKGYKLLDQGETDSTLEIHAARWSHPGRRLHLSPVFKVSLVLLGVLIAASLWMLKRMGPRLLSPEHFFPEGIILFSQTCPNVANTDSSNGI